MQTRREIIKSGLGLAGIIAAGKAPAALVRSLIAARSALTGSKKLPYDAEVEYLVSTGTQWINTGVKPDNNTQTDIDFMVLGNYSTYDTVAGCEGNGLSYRICARYGTSNRYWVGNSNASNYAVTTRTFNERQNVKFNLPGNVVEINGTQYNMGSLGTYVFTASLMLFAEGWGSGATFTSKARIYSAVITNCSSGELVRDFIPVRFTNELGQSEGAVYDRANPTVGMNPDGSPRTDGLYRNRGTGAFLWAEKQ